MTPDNKLVEALRELRDVNLAIYASGIRAPDPLRSLLDAAIGRAGAALSHPVPSAPEPSDRIIAEALRKVVFAYRDLHDDEIYKEPNWLRDALHEADLILSAPPVPAAAPVVEPTQPLSLSTLKVVVREAFMNGLAWMEANGDSFPKEWGPAAAAFVVGWEASEHNPLNYPYECASPEPATQGALCMCKDRPKSQCPGEWEPGCDLGANEKYVSVHIPSPEEKAAIDRAIASPAPEPLTPAAGVWISVDDRLPTQTDALSVLILHRKGSFADYMPPMQVASVLWCINGGMGSYTHWMPLPALPTEKQGD